MGGRPYTSGSLDSIKLALEEAGLRLVEASGYRFLVDLLPTDWRRLQNSDPNAGALVEQLLEIESELID
jgi:hypothetical protein